MLITITRIARVMMSSIRVNPPRREARPRSPSKVPSRREPHPGGAGVVSQRLQLLLLLEPPLGREGPYAHLERRAGLAQVRGRSPVLGVGRAHPDGVLEEDLRALAHHLGIRNLPSPLGVPLHVEGALVADLDRVDAVEELPLG